MNKNRHAGVLLGKFRSIQNAIFLVMALLVLSAIGIVTVISLNFTRTSIYENTITYTRQLTGQVNSDIDSYINYMENISSMLAENSDVQKFLFGSGIQAEEAGEQLMSQFATVLNSRSDIYNLGILQANGKALFNKGNSYINSYVDISQLAWYKEAVENKDSICLSSAHVQHVISGERPWVITLSRYIPDQTGKKEGGVLFVDLNYSAIRKLCDDSSVGKKGYIFIIDKEGNIVYHPQQQQLYNELQTENIEEVMNCTSDYLELGKGDSKKLYTVSRSEKTGWTVVSCSYTSELLKRSNQAQELYMLMAVILVAVALIISSIVSKGITRPIHKLQSSMALIQEGDFQAGNVEVDSRNEIGSLTETFNVMTQKIQELMVQIIEEQQAKRKSELKALQSQINPHFLYNTLDSIIWMAEEGKNEEVVVMTASLAKLFRQIISNEEEEISIFQEVEYCRNYLIIQKMRYKDKLEFEIDLDPDIKGEKIIKLVLQPLIENAIYHGLKYKESKGMLILKGYGLEDDIIFEIIDNGVGMDQDTMEHIFERHKVNYRSNGVGVYNVERRIRLSYGQEYGISYKSKLGEGTVATVKIPKERRDVHEKA
ncbi:MAG: sensor histidine kinase [Oliverpabstia sp.]|nr:sensor histidine kinase [Lachnospiraceae bacterium]MDY5025031.1 sensor histidine kinase [Oliverpabstia sp.]